MQDSRQEKRNFFSEFGRGFKAYGPAFRMLFTSRFAWFMVFPVLAWILFFWIGGLLVVWLGNPVEAWIHQGIHQWVGDISWLHHAGAVVAFLFRILIRIAYFLLFLSIGGYVVLIVLSPVFSWLSEQTEKALTGKDYPFRFGRFLREMWRGIMIAIRNTVFQFLVSVLLFFLSFIPIVGLFSPILFFLSSAYFYGFSFVDYTIERRYLLVRESVSYVNRNIGFVMGLGVPFAAALMLPYAKFLVCGFVSLASVMAATVAVCQTDGIGAASSLGSDSGAATGTISDILSETGRASANANTNVKPESSPGSDSDSGPCSGSGAGPASVEVSSPRTEE